MLSHYHVTSGVQPNTTAGDPLRSLFEAVAFAIEDSNYRYHTELQKVIPRAIFEAFSFPLRDQLTAFSNIQISRAEATGEPLVIPQGYLVARVDGVSYRTIADAVINPDGLSVITRVACTRPGTLGNTTTGTITVQQSDIPGILSVSNVTPATGGRDQETLEEQVQRFRRYYQSLRVGTLESIEAKVIGVTAGVYTVQDAIAIDKITKETLEPGQIELWIDDGAATAEINLINAAYNQALTVAPAGSDLKVYAATPKPFNVRYLIEKGTSAEIVRANSAIAGFASVLKIGEVILPQRIYKAIGDVVPNKAIRLEEPVQALSMGNTERGVLASVQGSRL
jgi:hypothetical protein